MGVPYETKPKAGIVIPGGETETLTVPFPPRSLISKVVVIQTAGAMDGFTVELFNHVDSLEATKLSESSSDPETHASIPLDCYRVGSPLSVPSGQSRLFYFSDEATGGHGLLFFCQDSPRADRRGQNMPNLYLRITPNGSGSKTFAFCIGGESQLGGV